MDLFYTWLTDTKAMTNRSARDVICRCKRVKKVINSDSLDENSLDLLIESDEYSDYSIFVRSQLKRALSLYQEYLKTVKHGK